MQNKSANGPKQRTNWNAVDWRQVNQCVRNLRQRIFRASRENDHRKVRSLQKLMLQSRANALKSVRQVSQKGKLTPGVDRIVVKTVQERAELVDRLMSHQPWRASPVRRVFRKRAASSALSASQPF